MIKQTLNLIKTNLLAISVALGICVFLYEALLKYNSGYPLTKYTALLILFIATYNKYSDKFIDQKPLPKSKYDLNWGVLKSYLKKRLNEAPVQIVIFSALYIFVNDKTYAHEYTILWTFGFVEGFFHYVKRRKYLEELIEKGQSEKEVNETMFIKQWEENRERGLLKCCLIDGGIIAGALISLLVSIVGLFILARNNDALFADGPGEIFQFIGVTYLIGAIIGIVSYRVIWTLRKKKFDRLTQLSH